MNPDASGRGPSTRRKAIRAGELDVASNNYATLTGEEPLTVHQVVERLVDELPLR